MSTDIDDRAHRAADALHAAAAERPRSVFDAHRGRVRRPVSVAAALVFVVGLIAVVAIVAAHRDHDRVSVSRRTVPPVTTARLGPDCPVVGPDAPWPHAGRAHVTSWAAVPQLVETFARGELKLANLPMPDPAAGRCAFSVPGHDGRAHISLGGNPATGYFVSGFDYQFANLDIPLSIEVTGRRITAHTSSYLCTSCPALALYVTYANTRARLTSIDGTFTGSLPTTPAGPGTVAVIGFDSRGLLFGAHGLVIPPGTFAAS